MWVGADGLVGAPIEGETAAVWQEPVGEIIERYDLGNVVCFATDFPHREGGTDPLGATSVSLSVQDQTTIERFYVDNARLIVPA